MKTTKEKFAELDGRIKLVNQKIDLIIKNHLFHMKKDQIKLSNTVLEKIVEDYTSESGVRGLEKKIASIAIGFDTKTDFQRMLGNYARMDYYQYGMGVDSGSFALILDYIKQKNYDVIIVSIHNTNRSPDKFYGINPNAIGFINQLNEEEKVVLVSFGIPYNLLYFPEMKHLVVGYQDTEINQEKAAQLLFGVYTNKSILPVNISDEYPKNAGISIDTQEQLLHYSYPEALGLATRRPRCASLA